MIEPLFRSSGFGRPCKYERREILNTIFYQARAGCAWAMLPHDLPPYRTVYKQVEEWRETGLWDRLLATLRGRGREAAARSTEPTAGSIDTQSVRTGGKRGAVTGTMKASKWLAVSDSW